MYECLALWMTFVNLNVLLIYSDAIRWQSGGWGKTFSNRDWLLLISGHQIETQSRTGHLLILVVLAPNRGAIICICTVLIYTVAG